MSLTAPKRILHVVSSTDRGGAETLIMNVYRNIDRNNVQFDFVSHSPKSGDYDKEIKELGGNIFRIPSLGSSGVIGYIKNLFKVMSSCQYQAIHIHTDYQSGIPALAGKMVGIKKRICHSHSTNWEKGSHLKERLILSLLQRTIKVFATDYCSCSMEAAHFLFGKKAENNDRVKILKNGVDVESFTHKDITFRDTLLNDLDLDSNTRILGHVGRFSPSKNQEYILKILYQLVNEKEPFVVIFVGDGSTRKLVENKARELRLENYVRFLGVREDIVNLMNAFDVFLLPSLFEGFGIVTLEAQCAGTPVIVSDKVPKSTDMGLGLIHYLPLKDDPQDWVHTIKKSKAIRKPETKAIYNHFTDKGFNIRESVSSWLNLYNLNDSTFPKEY